jgi:hypothetical protein
MHGFSRMKPCSISIELVWRCKIFPGYIMSQFRYNNWPPKSLGWFPTSICEVSWSICLQDMPGHHSRSYIENSVRHNSDSIRAAIYINGKHHSTHEGMQCHRSLYRHCLKNNNNCLQLQCNSYYHCCMWTIHVF